ncbi:MAG: ferrous iron transporter B, partial [Spirochaetes bacterium]|nr:ferrous iron transporter B [Spirochaetota bacterium]
PGTYTLKPTNEAECVAVDLIPEGDIIVNVIDATNLERNLFLTLQLLTVGKPMIIVLNMWDETKHKGIRIDTEQLESILKVPVITTCAISGEGVKELYDKLKKAKVSTFISKQTCDLKNEYIWKRIGTIISKVQKLYHHHHTFSQILHEMSVKPLTGIPFALFLLYISFLVIRFIGEGLINTLFNPLFERFITPLIMKLSSILSSSPVLHKILVGDLVNGTIDYFQSFGILTSGLYVPFAAVLPYVFAFYLVLTLLEDSGYLPRLAVLMDTLFHKIGLHGYAIIPTFLGLGCNVPAILATRILEDKKQRFIVSTLTSVAVPCTALQAMIFKIMGNYGFQYILAVYGLLFLVWVLLGFSLHKVMGGFTPELLIEIPPYRLPPMNLLWKKLYSRIKGFLLEAVPVVLAGIAIVNILYVFGIFQLISGVTAPVFIHLLGLPKEAVIAVVLGFLRKDIAMGMLLPLGLSLRQIFIATIMLAMTFPCIATFTVLGKELGIKYLVYAVLIMIFVALLAGTVLNLII